MRGNFKFANIILVFVYISLLEGTICFRKKDSMLICNMTQDERVVIFNEGCLQGGKFKLNTESIWSVHSIKPGKCQYMFDFFSECNHEWWIEMQKSLSCDYHLILIVLDTFEFGEWRQDITEDEIKDVVLDTVFFNYDSVKNLDNCKFYLF